MRQSKELLGDSKDKEPSKRDRLRDNGRELSRDHDKEKEREKDPHHSVASLPSSRSNRDEKKKVEAKPPQRRVDDGNGYVPIGMHDVISVRP